MICITLNQLKVVDDFFYDSLNNNLNINIFNSFKVFIQFLRLNDVYLQINFKLPIFFYFLSNYPT